MRINTKEYELRRRTGQPSYKETLRDTAKEIFETSLSETQLSDRLAEAGFQLYTRGESEGLESTADGTRYRLRTLGLSTALQKTHSRLRVYAEREAELALLRGRQAHQRDKPDNQRDR